MRHWPVLLCAILILGCARGEDEAPKDSLPPLDIVVTAKLNTNKEHMAKYAKAVQNEVTNLFPRLVRLGFDNKEAPKDGAAQYRLQIDVTGTFTIGNAITSALQKNLFTDGKKEFSEAFLRIFYIAAQQQTTGNCKLLKWEEGKYTEVMKWTAPLVKRIDEEKSNGAMEIGRVAGISAQQDSNKPPMTVEQAKQFALDNLMPGSITDGVLSKLVEVKLVKAEPGKDKDPAVLSADISVTNKSPWPLGRVAALFLWKNSLISVGDTQRGFIQIVEFAEPLKPNEPQKLTVKAKAVTDKAMKPGIREADFAGLKEAAAP